MHGSLATTMAILINMLTFCQEHFIAKVEQEKDILEHSIISTLRGALARGFKIKLTLESMVHKGQGFGGKF